MIRFYSGLDSPLLFQDMLLRTSRSTNVLRGFYFVVMKVADQTDHLDLRISFSTECMTCTGVTPCLGNAPPYVDRDESLHTAQLFHTVPYALYIACCLSDAITYQFVFQFETRSSDAVGLYTMHQR